MIKIYKGNKNESLIYVVYSLEKSEVCVYVCVCIIQYFRILILKAHGSSF